jgi:hypothetical protein
MMVPVSVLYGIPEDAAALLRYLREHDALEFFGFFSFEWYPFDDVCADPAVPLAQHPTLLADIVRRQEAAGLPPEVPKVITEYGYPSSAGPTAASPSCCSTRIRRERSPSRATTAG